MPRKPFLSGRAYLVIEDEYLVALHLCTELEDAGARILGPTSRMDEAFAFLENDRHALDAVILDINLHGTPGYAIADRLLELGMPFVFVTGYDCRSLPERFQEVPCFSKPFNDNELLSALAAMPAGGGR